MSKRPSNKPAAIRDCSGETQASKFRLSIADIAALKRLQAHHCLTTMTETIRQLIRRADRAIGPTG